MKKSFIFKVPFAFLCLFFVATRSAAQITEETPHAGLTKKLRPHRRFQLGLNISNVIANAVGSRNDADFLAYQDPYQLNFWWQASKKPHQAFRLGVGWNFNSTKEVRLTTGIVRTKAELPLAGRFGYKWRAPLTDRFYFSYGIDAVANYWYSNAQTAVAGDLTDLIINELVVGGGGALGLRWQDKSGRIDIGTEALLYFTAGTEKRKLIDRKLGVLEDSKKDRTYVSNFLPQSLYLILRF